MMCIGLNYSNEMVFRLEYKETRLIESSLSGIEILSSNVLKKVDSNFTNSNNKDEFDSYFLGNNFEDSISDISGIEISNLKVNIVKENPFYVDGTYNFKITSSANEGKYSKKYQAKVKINNPFLDYKEEEMELENFKNNIKVSDLVKIYNYKEN
ncbi:MAG: hypothetical protein ACRDA3_08805 [Peptostreptococcaceae bacterium]